MRTILFAALLLLPAAPAWAEDPADRAEQRAKKVIAKKDRDGDGKLSRDELGVEQVVFDALDRNGDGFIDATELKSNRRRRPAKSDRKQNDRPEARGDRSARMFKKLDKDGDGAISKEEWPADARVPFDRVDADGNGRVSKSELARVAARGRGADGRGREMDPKQVREMAIKIMEHLDRNGDKKITRDEIFQPRAKDGDDKAKGAKGRRGAFRGVSFEKIDQNHDGAVDLLELTVLLSESAARQRERGRRGPDPRRLQRMLKSMDADQDGRITREEWKGADPFFKRLDANEDGVITSDEVAAMIEKMGRWRGRGGEAMFRRWDTNKDGRISREEWKVAPEMFERFDRNKDGSISADEVMLFQKRGRRARRGPDVRSGKNSAHFLADYDKNRDGQVGKDEFPHERRFAEIDADSNGVLSKAEIEEAMDKRMRESKLGFFERFDLDGDGKVTRSEFTGPASAFERKDRNNDGVIDSADEPDKKR